MEGSTEQVLDLGEAGRWLRILDDEAAMAAQVASETAVGLYFRHDADRNGGSPRHRYYALVRDGEIGVVLRVPAEGEPVADRMDRLVTGYRNGDPYPSHAPAIAGLASAIGVELPPEAYPYRSMMADDGADSEVDKPDAPGM